MQMINCYVSRLLNPLEHVADGRMRTVTGSVLWNTLFKQPEPTHVVKNIWNGDWNSIKTFCVLCSVFTSQNRYSTHKKYGNKTIHFSLFCHVFSPCRAACREAELDIVWKACDFVHIGVLWGYWILPQEPEGDTGLIRFIMLVYCM